MVEGGIRGTCAGFAIGVRGPPFLLSLRDESNKGSHLGCSDTRGLVVAGRGGEHSVVVLGLMDAGDVVEVTCRVVVVQQVEKRVGVAEAAAPQAVGESCTRSFR